MSEIVQKITEKLREYDFLIEDRVSIQGSKKGRFYLKRKKINRNDKEGIDLFSKMNGPLTVIAVQTDTGNHFVYEPLGQNKWVLSYVLTSDKGYISKDDIKKLQNALEISI